MMHYHRQYRYGTLERTTKPGEVRRRKSDGRGIVALDKSHPLVKDIKVKRTYYSRLVVYEKNKNNTDWKCHWCGCSLSLDTFEADHVDENPTNDAAQNLVLSCSKCNVSRSREKAYKNYIESSCVKIEVDGKIWTTKMISEKLGISYMSVINRLKRGWSAHDIVNKPRGVHGPKRTARKTPALQAGLGVPV